MKYIINNKDYSNEVNSLMDFAQKRLGFSKKPKVLFSNDLQNAHKTLGKTGYYDPNTTEVHIFMTGRHVKDILRSLAHELVHHMQNENGDLTHDGYMGQGYAQKNPKMREMERQAFEMGNLCFRDWEDGLKEKHPTIYNERRNHKMSLKDWKNKELNRLLLERFGIRQEAKPGASYQEGEADYVLGMTALDGLKDAGFDVTTLERPMSRDGRVLSYSAPHRNKQGKYQEFKKILINVLKNDPKMKQVIDNLMQGEYKGQGHLISQFFFGMDATSPSDFDTEFLDPIVKPDEEEQLEEDKKNMVKGPDGKMVPDYAADGEGDNDLAKGNKAEDSKDKDENPDKEESGENKKFKPKKGEVPPQFKKNMKESLDRKIRVKIKK